MEEALVGGEEGTNRKKKMYREDEEDLEGFHDVWVGCVDVGDEEVMS